MRLLVEQHDLDLIFLYETKRRKVINLYSELGCGDEYRVVQLKSTEANRGGIIVIIKTELQLVTAEIVKVYNGNNFAQAVVLTEMEERAFIGWYNSPLMSREALKGKLTKLYQDYNVQFIADDFNARHPRWCTSHEGHRRETQLLHLIRTFPEHQIHAPREHTFEVLACKANGTKRTSTVDIVVGKATITGLHRVTGYIAACSDHLPLAFTADAQLEVVNRPWRIAKTMLQYRHFRTTISLLYDLSLRPEVEKLQELTTGMTEVPQTEHIKKVFTEAEEKIAEPWVAQTKKRRRRCGAYVSAELLRL